MLDARPDLHQLVVLPGVFELGLSHVVRRLRRVQLLLGNDALLGQVLSALEDDGVVGEVGLGLLDGGARGVDLLRARTVFQFCKPALGHSQVGLGLFELSPVLRVLQAHQDLALFDTITLLDSHPGNFAHNLRADLDRVVRHDVARGVQCHARSSCGPG